MNASVVRTLLEELMPSPEAPTDLGPLLTKLQKLHGMVIELSKVKPAVNLTVLPSNLSSLEQQLRDGRQATHKDLRQLSSQLESAEQALLEQLRNPPTSSPSPSDLAGMLDAMRQQIDELRAPFLEERFDEIYRELNSISQSMPSPAPDLRPMLDTLYAELTKGAERHAAALHKKVQDTDARPNLVPISNQLDKILFAIHNQPRPSPVSLTPVLNKLGEIHDDIKRSSSMVPAKPTQPISAAHLRGLHAKLDSLVHSSSSGITTGQFDAMLNSLAQRLHSSIDSSVTLSQMQSLLSSLADAVRPSTPSPDPRLDELLDAAYATHANLRKHELSSVSTEDLAAARADLAERVEALSSRLNALAAAKLSEPHPPQYSLAPVMAAIRALETSITPSDGARATQAALETVLRRMQTSDWNHDDALRRQLLALQDTLLNAVKPSPPPLPMRGPTEVHVVLKELHRWMRALNRTVEASLNETRSMPPLALPPTVVAPTLSEISALLVPVIGAVRNVSDMVLPLQQNVPLTKLVLEQQVHLQNHFEDLTAIVTRMMSSMNRTTASNAELLTSIVTKIDKIAKCIGPTCDHPSPPPELLVEPSPPPEKENITDPTKPTCIPPCPSAMPDWMKGPPKWLTDVLDKLKGGGQVAALPPAPPAAPRSAPPGAPCEWVDRETGRCGRPKMPMCERNELGQVKLPAGAKACWQLSEGSSCGSDDETSPEAKLPATGNAVPLRIIEPSLTKPLRRKRHHRKRPVPLAQPPGALVEATDSKAAAATAVALVGLPAPPLPSAHSVDTTANLTAAAPPVATKATAAAPAVRPVPKPAAKFVGAAAARTTDALFAEPRPRRVVGAAALLQLESRALAMPAAIRELAESVANPVSAIEYCVFRKARHIVWR